MNHNPLSLCLSLHAGPFDLQWGAHCHLCSHGGAPVPLCSNPSVSRVRCMQQLVWYPYYHTTPEPHRAHLAGPSAHNSTIVRTVVAIVTFNAICASPHESQMKVPQFRRRWTKMVPCDLTTRLPLNNYGIYSIRHTTQYKHTSSILAY